jgi:hypothetical protein
MDMPEELNETELINLLKGARVSIDQGLANLGVTDDEVEGYQLPSVSFGVAASPALVAKLGSGFTTADQDGTNVICVNHLCP